MTAETATRTTAADVAAVAPTVVAARQQLCVVHPFDPRGIKIGGIETHVRTLIQRHPADVDLKLVGTDGRGDLQIGQPVRIELAGRAIEFLPLLRYDDAEATEFARTLGRSVTLQLARAIFAHLGAVRRFAGAGVGTIEVQRPELSWLPMLLRRPFVLVQHNEEGRAAKSDALISKHWYVQSFAEALALRQAGRILCVNDAILRRIVERHPGLADRCRHMTVSIDTDVFPPAPFETADGVLRLFYAGRLSEQKDPGLMLATIAALAERLAGRLEFHYAGTSPIDTFPEFAAVRDVTVRHGFQNQAGVARLLAKSHAGILTSHFEGMPCGLLETLAVGRPMGAIRLPQFESVVRAGETGFLVDRQPERARSAALMADGFVALWDDIRAGRYRPEVIRQTMWPYSTEVQLPRLFAMHRELAR